MRITTLKIKTMNTKNLIHVGNSRGDGITVQEFRSRWGDMLDGEKHGQNYTIGWYESRRR
jgi:hypothetical protein